MIAEIRLENLKRFRELALKTEALTILTGANGTGKTSVIHALLLARKMARQPRRNHAELNGVDTLELGGAEDIIHREAGEEELTAVEVRDSRGTNRRWSFRAVGSNDAHALNAIVVDRPDDCPGALAGAASRFSYLRREKASAIRQTNPACRRSAAPRAPEVRQTHSRLADHDRWTPPYHGLKSRRATSVRFFHCTGMAGSRQWRFAPDVRVRTSREWLEERR